MQDAAASSRTRQLELIRRLQDLSPAPCLLGGFAEDALLYGGYSRDHGDVDLLVPRSRLERLQSELRMLGYDTWKTRGENAAGEPFYLEARAEDLLLELGVTDGEDSGELFAELATVDWGAPAGIRVHLPPDTYDYAPVEFEGVSVRCISPLAAFQLRAGIATRGTFGPLRPKDQAASRGLRERYFPDAREEELLPRVEML